MVARSHLTKQGRDMLTLPDADVTSSAVHVPRGLRKVMKVVEHAGARCSLVLPSGEQLLIGNAPPEFELRLNSLDAFTQDLDELSLGEAYIAGEFDIEGDMIAASSVAHSIVELAPRRKLVAHWLRRFTSRRPRHASIAMHYGRGNDLFHTYLDRQYHLYSHGLYCHEDDSLEVAAEAKLRAASEALALSKGARLLDVGCGWGCVARYFGSRGIDVTCLTVVRDQAEYVSQVIAREGLTAQVHLRDFYDHRASRPYDGIIALGSISHFPQYRRFLTHARSLLTPGATLYVDEVASRGFQPVGALARKYIWTDTGHYLLLPRFLAEVERTRFCNVTVLDETRDYALTCAGWARRWEEARDEASAKWGEPFWRLWRVYLWGAAALLTGNELQTYRVTARREG